MNTNNNDCKKVAKSLTNILIKAEELKLSLINSYLHREENDKPYEGVVIADLPEDAIEILDLIDRSVESVKVAIRN